MLARVTDSKIDFDERRVIILKAQNGQLTKQNAFLQELCTKQADLCIGVSTVLSEAISTVKDDDIKK